MKLAVFSHKLVWKSNSSNIGYATDGGFAMHMWAISLLFDQTTVVVPCSEHPKLEGQNDFYGNIKIFPVQNINAVKLKRKLIYPFWLLKNIFSFYQIIKKADAIHVPIPSDMGTIGMLMAFWMKKPLFVRHCGNWFVQNTKAEVWWKSFMVKHAGGLNVMFATGGNSNPPSDINPNIDWIFSSSLKKSQIESLKGDLKEVDFTKLEFITISRQEKQKGADTLIELFPRVLKKFPNSILKIVGEGPYLENLKEMVKVLSLEKSIIFYGKVNHSHVLTLLKESDIFLYPTRASEGFPKVVFEALACGKPVIANSVSVIPQLLSMGGGISLKNNSEQEILDSIEIILSSPEKFKKFQRDAQLSISFFSLENWSKTIGDKLEKSWNRKLKN